VSELDSRTQLKQHTAASVSLNLDLPEDAGTEWARKHCASSYRQAARQSQKANHAAIAAKNMPSQRPLLKYQRQF
jgi:hypothetical protein